MLYLLISTCIFFNILAFHCKITEQIYFRTQEHFRASFFDIISLFSFFPFCARGRGEWAGPGHCRASLGSRTDIPVNTLCSQPKPEHIPEYFLLTPHLFLPSKTEGKKANPPTLNKNPKHTQINTLINRKNSNK